jgi:hypothetical protein
MRGVCTSLHVLAYVLGGHVEAQVYADALLLRDCGCMRGVCTSLHVLAYVLGGHVEAQVCTDALLLRDCGLWVYAWCVHVTMCACLRLS